MSASQEDQYPAYINDKPPIISLKQYDESSWAKSTCIDKIKDGAYIIVLVEDPTKVIAQIDSNDDETLHKIFRSAHENYYKNQK